MKNRAFTVGGLLDTVASAIAVSNAVRENRMPRASDLVRLGINPGQFSGIKTYRN